MIHLFEKSVFNSIFHFYEWGWFLLGFFVVKYAICWIRYMYHILYIYFSIDEDIFYNLSLEFIMPFQTNKIKSFVKFKVFISFNSTQILHQTYLANLSTNSQQANAQSNSKEILYLTVHSFNSILNGFSKWKNPAFKMVK